MERLNIKGALTMALQIKGVKKAWLYKQGFSSRTIFQIENDAVVKTTTIESLAYVFNLKPLHFLQLADMKYITVETTIKKKRGEV